MNELKHLREFRDILNNYKISEASKKTLDATRLVLLLAATSTGKNTLIREMVSTNRYHYIISDTTRLPRLNDGVAETNGVEYWFRAELDFLEDLRAGNYLEAEIIHDQQVSGISVRELLRASKEDKIAVTDVDLTGMANVVRAASHVVPVLLLPPSFDEWQRRISSRGAMPKEEFYRRMQTASRIFAAGLLEDYFYLLIAEETPMTVAKIDNIIESGTYSDTDRQRGVAVLKELLLKTNTILESVA